MSIREISLDDLVARLQTAAIEQALLDVGEEGEYGTGHLLRAVNAPYSQLERIVGQLVPRLGCPVVLLDHGHGIAALAAKRLQAMGYSDVQLLAGGHALWQAQTTQALFYGVFGVSKAFGEWVGEHYATPMLQPDALAKWIEQKADVVVLDPRTVAEYKARHIPTAIACPGAELMYRIQDLAPSPSTTVVVACGGRTRGLIGAQSLIDAGIPNKVFALNDGLHGWQLANHPLAQDATQVFGSTSAAAQTIALERAAALRQRFALPLATAEQVQHWQSAAERAQRTTVVVDVRTAEEFASGSVAGAIHAPGGQLVQATDRWLGTWGARIVLVDDNGVRATASARWLKQMGWEVHIAPIATGATGATGATKIPTDASAESNADSNANANVETAATTLILPLTGSAKHKADEAAKVEVPRTAAPRIAAEISLQEAVDMLEQAAAGLAPQADAAVIAIHCDNSAQYLQGTVGTTQWTARWANRARLSPWRTALQNGAKAVVFSADSEAAHLLANDLQEALPPEQRHNVLVVRGGLQAWIEAGLPTIAPAPASLVPEQDQRIDTLFWAASRRQGDRVAMRVYLDWEKQLLAQVRQGEPQFPQRTQSDTGVADAATTTKDTSPMSHALVTIAAPEGQGSYQAIHLPANANNGKPKAAIVVLAEIYNLNAWIEVVGQKYVAEGWEVLIPDLYWRQPEGRGIALEYNPEDQQRGRAFGGAVDRAQSALDVLDAVRFLRAKVGAGVPIATVGYCIGGELALLAAAEASAKADGLDAAIAYYPTFMERHLAKLPAIALPTIVNIGELDHRTPPELVAQLREGLAGNAQAQVDVYLGANHGFGRFGHPPFHAESAVTAHQRLVALVNSLASTAA
ncbi:hypothetical protein E9531_02625 [Lampropedia puyangensis]|uniref:Rhodanese domain-containing protein n=1 Tax=Lampropedia puyangensis TaxID=1330072 RepID=A0A4S8FD47_9BURK|nr:rhodanese-like domain-containing protein [Lampropedia puyangensis]THU05450.1 hypothetical protein E9531_02625 [Lampropedia puyangensis]